MPRRRLVVKLHRRCLSRIAPLTWEIFGCERNAVLRKISIWIICAAVSIIVAIGCNSTFAQQLNVASSVDQTLGFDNKPPAIRSAGEFWAVPGESKQSISVGDLFLAEVVTCRAQFFTKSGESPIEKIRPYCGCVSTRLSDPVLENGISKRELLFTIKGKSVGKFHSKIEFCMLDGTVSTFSLEASVFEAITVEPAAVALDLLVDAQQVTLRAKDARLSLENATVVCDDDRFVLSSLELSPRTLRFNLALASSNNSVRMLNPKSVGLTVSLSGRTINVDLPIKQKRTDRIVPSTLTVIPSLQKPVRVFLFGSSESLAKTTGQARMVFNSDGIQLLATGMFHRRNGELGLIEFEVPWLDIQRDHKIESGTSINIELEVSDEAERNWVSYGSLIVYFQGERR